MEEIKSSINILMIDELKRIIEMLESNTCIVEDIKFKAGKYFLLSNPNMWCQDKEYKIIIREFTPCNI